MDADHESLSAQGQNEATAEAALGRRRSSWVAAVNAGSVDGHASLIGEQVLWLRPGQLALYGRKQVLDWLAPFFDQFEYRFSVERAALRITDDWAVDRGVFTSRVRPRGAELWDEHTGVYLITWRLEPDGLWYVYQYVDVTGLLAVDSGERDG